MTTSTTLTYQAFEDRKSPGDWRAEAIDHDSEGECYVVIFSGPDAQARAQEYAAWKNDARQPMKLAQG